MASGIAQSIIDRQQWIDDLSDAIQPLINKAFSSGGETGHVVKDLLNGVWLGHPLHPVITDVPVGAWTITELLDLLSAAQGDDPGLDAASDVSLGAGILAALGAAVTGITDWSDVGGSHRRLGMAHALMNVAGLTLNVSSLALRVGGNGRARGAARVLSAAGYLTTAVSAYVAGELVYGLGMAINRQAWVAGPEEYTDAASEGDLVDGQMLKVDVDGTPVVLLQHEDGTHAFAGTCPHYGCGLWEGKLDGHILTCPCHGSQFDVSTGALVHGPATSPIAEYDVQRREGRVQVRLRQ